MSHYIPVFFFPIKDNIPENDLKGWQSVFDVVPGLSLNQAGGNNKVRMSTSRNWWYQDATSLICRGLGINGLGFVDKEIVCLDHDDLVAALDALDKVLDGIKYGVPSLGSEIDKKGTIWWLCHYWDENGQAVDYSKDIVNQAYHDAQPEWDLYVEIENGYDSIVGYFAFLKSLRAAITEALAGQKNLMYVQPQP